MPTQIKTPAEPVCSRCGDRLYGSQAAHDADHAGAERILALAAQGDSDQWLMGSENSNESSGRKEFEFLPLTSFVRLNGEHHCGRQLHYHVGGYWPRNNALQVMTADQALQAGMLPWSSLFPRRDAPNIHWPPVVDAIMRLPVAQRRELLLGRPIPAGLASHSESFTIVETFPTQFWLRNGSLPIRLWSGADGGYLHINAYSVLNALHDSGLLESCLPGTHSIFRAFDLVGPNDVKVVILGQDPYPTPGDAMGLSFSCNAAKLPASLRNIYKEMTDDLGSPAPVTGDLTYLAYQGVLLANTALTIGTNGQTHFDHWQSFTSTWIAAIASTRPVVWILWGNHAKKWLPLIKNKSREAGLSPVIIESAHPSPLSARRGFFGSKPFSKANEGLKRLGLPPVRWLP